MPLAPMGWLASVRYRTRTRWRDSARSFEIDAPIAGADQDPAAPRRFSGKRHRLPVCFHPGATTPCREGGIPAEAPGIRPAVGTWDGGPARPAVRPAVISGEKNLLPAEPEGRRDPPEPFDVRAGNTGSRRKSPTSAGRQDQAGKDPRARKAVFLLYALKGGDITPDGKNALEIVVPVI